MKRFKYAKGPVKRGVFGVSGSMLGLPGAPKERPVKTLILTGRSCGAPKHPKSAQAKPKRSQESPKSNPREPNRCPNPPPRQLPLEDTRREEAGSGFEVPRSFQDSFPRRTHKGRKHMLPTFVCSPREAILEGAGDLKSRSRFLPSCVLQGKLSWRGIRASVGLSWVALGALLAPLGLRLGALGVFWGST